MAALAVNAGIKVATPGQVRLAKPTSGTRNGQSEKLAPAKLSQANALS